MADSLSDINSCYAKTSTDLPQLSLVPVILSLETYNLLGFSFYKIQINLLEYLKVKASFLVY